MPTIDFGNVNIQLTLKIETTSSFWKCEQSVDFENVNNQQTLKNDRPIIFICLKTSYCYILQISNLRLELEIPFELVN